MNRNLSIELTAIPAEAEWILYELHFQHDGEALFELSAAWPHDDSDRTCAMAYAGATGFTAMGLGAHSVTVGSSSTGEEPLLERHVGMPWFNEHISMAVGPVAAGERIPVLLALHDARAWIEDGAKALMSVNSTAPFVASRVASGTMACVTSLNEYPKGEHVQSPMLTKASGLEAPLRFNETGFGWVFVSADAGYKAQVVGPQGLVWEDSSSPPEFEGSGGKLFEALPAGDYLVRVPEIQGTDVSAKFALVDLPAWATDVMQERRAARS